MTDQKKKTEAGASEKKTLSPVQQLFPQVVVADESKLRLWCYESNGECFVRCKVTPLTTSFRIKGSEELFKFVKAEHAKTKAEEAKAKAEKVKA